MPVFDVELPMEVLTLSDDDSPGRTLELVRGDVYDDVSLLKPGVALEVIVPVAPLPADVVERAEAAFMQIHGE